MSSSVNGLAKDNVGYQPRRHLSQMHSMNYTRFTREKATYWKKILPDSVDFSSFTRFKRTLKRVSFTQFLIWGRGGRLHRPPL